MRRKAVQRQLGHKSATLTLDRHGHLFPDEMDALAAALEAMRSAGDLRAVEVTASTAEAVHCL